MKQELMSSFGVRKAFLFLIRNKDDGLLLFAGAVENPSFD